MDGNIYFNHHTVGYGLYSLTTLVNDRIRINGFNIGCLPLDGFFSSTLECYYNRTHLLHFVSNSAPFTSLASTAETRFSPSTSINKLIENSLVEKWSVKLSFADYFTACVPATCSNSFNQRNNFLVIFTTIIALIGGLNRILNKKTFSFLLFLSRRIHKMRHQSATLLFELFNT